MKRAIYHVVPQSGVGWQVKKQGIDTPEGAFANKVDALAAAKALAKANVPSQVIVHRQDGTFEDEYTYGNDPYPPKG